VKSTQALFSKAETSKTKRKDLGKKHFNLNVKTIALKTTIQNTKHILHSACEYSVTAALYWKYI